jgi:hypothetical protein
MYLDYRPDSFEYNEETKPQGFQGAVSTPDAFELEYLIQNIEQDYYTPAVAGLAVTGRTMAGASDYSDRIQVYKIRIIKKTGKSPEFRRIDSETGEEIELSGKQEIKKILPDFILGYSSGENEIVSLPFYKMRFIHFDEYRSILIRDDFYGQVPEGRLVYLDEHLNQSILLANFLMQKNLIFPSLVKNWNYLILSNSRLLLENIILRHYMTICLTIFLPKIYQMNQKRKLN